MSIEKFLKRFRNKFNLTQAEVARKTGISPQVYNTYETGGSDGKVKTPSITVLIKISQAFNVSIDYLAGISNNPEINYAPPQKELTFEILQAEIESLKARIEVLEKKI